MRTGFLALLMRPAAAAIASVSAAPRLARAAGVRTSPVASPVMMSFGALMNAAPGRPDSAARKALATTSETEPAESISALNFVTGRKRLTVSIL